GIVAAMSPLEKAEGVTANDADRTDFDDASSLSRNREKLFGLLARGQSLDAELAAAVAYGEYDPRGQDRAVARVGERQCTDRSLADDHTVASEVECDVVLGSSDQEERAENQSD